MKAEIKPRIDLKNRTKLEEVIPLKTPFIINIDPSDRCNFQCKFCPTGDRELMKKTPGRNHGLMDFELYKKVGLILKSFKFSNIRSAAAGAMQAPILSESFIP